MCHPVYYISRDAGNPFCCLCVVQVVILHGLGWYRVILYYMIKQIVAAFHNSPRGIQRQKRFIYAPPPPKKSINTLLPVGPDPPPPYIKHKNNKHMATNEDHPHTPHAQSAVADMWKIVWSCVWTFRGHFGTSVTWVATVEGEAFLFFSAASWRLPVAPIRTAMSAIGWQDWSTSSGGGTGVGCRLLSVQPWLGVLPSEVLDAKSNVGRARYDVRGVTELLRHLPGQPAFSTGPAALQNCGSTAFGPSRGALQHSGCPARWRRLQLHCPQRITAEGGSKKCLAARGGAVPPALRTAAATGSGAQWLPLGEAAFSCSGQGSPLAAACTHAVSKHLHCNPPLHMWCATAVCKWRRDTAAMSTGYRPRAFDSCAWPSGTGRHVAGPDRSASGDDHRTKVVWAPFRPRH